MARSSFKEWTQNVQTARDSLRKAQKRVNELESVSGLIKDARLDTLEELKDHLQYELNEVRSRQSNSDRLSGHARGILRSIEILEDLKSDIRNGESGF